MDARRRSFWRLLERPAAATIGLDHALFDQLVRVRDGRANEDSVDTYAVLLRRMRRSAGRSSSSGWRRLAAALPGKKKKCGSPPQRLRNRLEHCRAAISSGAPSMAAGPADGELAAEHMRCGGRNARSCGLRGQRPYAHGPARAGLQAPRSEQRIVWRWPRASIGDHPVREIDRIGHASSASPGPGLSPGLM